MNNEDDIVDVEANSREEIRKGKTPRKLFLTVAVICLGVLMSVGIFVNYNSINKAPEHNAKISDIKGQEAKDSVKTTQTYNSVARAEKEQSDEALARVKGSNRSTGIEGFDQKNDPDIADLRDPSRSSQSVSRSVDPGKDGHVAQDAARQKRETILTAGIFKGGAQRSAPAPVAQDPIEAELLRKLSQQSGAASPALPPDLSALNAMRPQPPKTASEKELDFNASMESKRLNPPTGIIEKTNNNCVLREGWLIPVANMEAMNSDQPGELTLYVRRNVYGSYNNHCLAIPAGTTIIASYNPNIAIGQERFNVAATVMQFPNGKRVPMAGTRAYDAQGAAGIDAEVNNHFFKIVGTSLMLGVAARLAGDDKTSTSTVNGSTTTNSTVLGKTIGETAQTILERNKNISPTLTKDAGVRFNLKVSREFLMENYRD